MRGADLESAAALVLSQVTKQQHFLLSEGSELGLHDLHKILLGASIPAAHGRAFDRAYDVLQSLVELLIERVAAPLMNCEAHQVHCPPKFWIPRVEGAGSVAEVHIDNGIPSGSLDAKWFDVRTDPRAVANASLSSWFNFWVLLSEETGRAPLVLLDPATTRRADWKRLGWAAGRAFAFDGMQRGDIVWWRSDAVPHATGVLSETPTRHDQSTPLTGGLSMAYLASLGLSLRTRSSFDFRCTCDVSASEPSYSFTR